MDIKTIAAIIERVKLIERATNLDATHNDFETKALYLSGVVHGVGLVLMTCYEALDNEHQLQNSPFSLGSKWKWCGRHKDDNIIPFEIVGYLDDSTNAEVHDLVGDGKNFWTISFLKAELADGNVKPYKESSLNA